MLAKLKILVLKFVKPFQIWIQRRGRRETVITQDQVDRIVRLALPGDILLSYEAQRWTSIFIKGFYDHAVIISSRGTVVEAVGDLWEELPDGTKVNRGGVREVPLEEWLFKKDYVALIRVKNPHGQLAGMNALTYIGRGYDYVFSHDNENLYCSETAYVCWRPVMPAFLVELSEDKEILPQVYLDLCSKVPYLECLIDTKPA